MYDPSDPFSKLPDAQRREMWANSIRNDYCVDDLLLLGGHGLDGRLHVLRRGLVRYVGRDVHGREATIDVGGPGELIGLSGVVLGSPEPCDVIALSPCISYSFPGRLAFETLVAHRDAAGTLIAQMVKMRKRSVETAVERSTSRLAQRLAARLLQVHADSAERWIGPMSHLTLAQLAGGSRERVCLEMIKLRSAGIIDYGREGLTVLKPDVLERVRCGEPA